MYCKCLDFQNYSIAKLTDLFAEYGDVFFKFGDIIGRCFLTHIIEEISDSPKSARGNLLYSNDEKMFFAKDCLLTLVKSRLAL